MGDTRKVQRRDAGYVHAKRGVRWPSRWSGLVSESAPPSNLLIGLGFSIGRRFRHRIIRFVVPGSSHSSTSGSTARREGVTRLGSGSAVATSMSRFLKTPARVATQRTGAREHDPDDAS